LNAAHAEDYLMKELQFQKAYPVVIYAKIIPSPTFACNVIAVDGNLCKQSMFCSPFDSYDETDRLESFCSFINAGRDFSDKTKIVLQRYIKWCMKARGLAH
jgi:hypothetical protein